MQRDLQGMGDIRMGRHKVNGKYMGNEWNIKQNLFPPLCLILGVPFQLLPPR